MSDVEVPLVSLIIVNYRGAEDTVRAVRSVLSGTGSDVRVEALVVDNASGDGSVDVLRRDLDNVTIIESQENVGFAGGCNLAAGQAQGQYIALLNPDAIAQPGWLDAAIDAFRADPRCGAVASKVLSEDGRLVDFVGAGLTWFGMGVKPFLGLPEPRDTPSTEVLFGTGAAMVVRADVWRELGGFDEQYFMFFEDVDLGWRLNLAGYRFTYEPRSVVFHRHHGSMGEVRSFRERYLLERNALFTLHKNLGEERLHRVMASAIALSISRSMAEAGVDTQSLDVARAHASDADEITLDARALPGPFAVDQFVKHLPELHRKRQAIQASRKSPEARIIALSGLGDVPGPGSTRYLDDYEGIMSTLRPLEVAQPKRVLFITGDPLSSRLAGPAIRTWNMASAAGHEHEVRVISTSRSERTSALFETHLVRPGDERGMRVHVEWADVIVFQGLALDQFRALRRTRKPIVVDIYDPIHVEHLEQSRRFGAAEWGRRIESATEVMTQQLARGDFFMCASERQRLFWLGHLASIGRVNPQTYVDDPTLAALIAVVPFGLPDEPPAPGQAVMKGVMDGIGADDKVILWSGGLYDWFDPMVLIRAMALLRQTHPDVHLVFMGASNPNPSVGEMPIVDEVRGLARELGLLDTTVHIKDGWVAYDDRHHYLLEADLGVSTHHAHVETALSFRTRILDFLWSGLPMVVTDGDFFADLVRDRGLGDVVAPGDPDGLARAIRQLLDNDAARADAHLNVSAVGREFTWSTVLEPLMRYLENPQPAPDLTGKARSSRSRHGLVRDLARTWKYLRSSGPRAVLIKVRSRLVRRA